MNFDEAVQQLRAGHRVKRPGMDSHLEMRDGGLFYADGRAWSDGGSFDDTLAHDWVVVLPGSPRPAKPVTRETVAQRMLELAQAAANNHDIENAARCIEAWKALVSA